MSNSISAKVMLKRCLLLPVFVLLLGFQAPGRAATDLVNNPVEPVLQSEPVRNRVYETSVPLIDKYDQVKYQELQQDLYAHPTTPYVTKRKRRHLQGRSKHDHQSKWIDGYPFKLVVPAAGKAMSDGGYVLPSGKYHWEGPDIGVLDGVVPNPTYAQLLRVPDADVNDVANGPMMYKLRDAMNGLPITNSQFADLVGLASQAAVDQALDPKQWRDAMTQMQETQTAQNSDQQAECARINGDAAIGMIQSSLINVANEAAGTRTSENDSNRTYSQAVWLVQQMFKSCYVYIAVLLLLPGVILTQLKSLICFSLSLGGDDDTANPLSGILRAVIAIFLIPASQLIVSYSIDIGNALSYAVTQNTNTSSISVWAREQTFNTLPSNNHNYVKKITDYAVPDKIRGKLASVSKDTTVFEQQSYVTTALQNIFNTLSNLVSNSLVILTAFQLVLMCYLFLLGPIAAAFFAWPAGVGQDLFRKTFSSWLNAIVSLATWKFWWCLVLLCMAVRLDSGTVNPNDLMEMYVHEAFLVLLLFVPFQPFTFRPGEIVATLLEQATKKGIGAGSQGPTAASGQA